eukprot:9644665-Karenia_brevis.AAC.1
MLSIALFDQIVTNGIVNSNTKIFHKGATQDMISFTAAMSGKRVLQEMVNTGAEDVIGFNTAIWEK